MSSNQLHADTAVVEAIKLSVKPQLIQSDDRVYFDRPLYLPPEEATVETLKTHTLQSIVDFLMVAREQEWASEAIIHIKNHETVSLVSPLLHRSCQRQTYLTSDCSELTKIRFRFGQFQKPEDFIISLLSEFVEGEEREAALKLVGNLKSEHVTENSDDGFSQSVTVRKGVSRVASVAAPSIIRLAPYRTFRELNQPESAFLLRFRQSSNLPEVALFEADGSAWKHAAIQSARKWLMTSLEEEGLGNMVIS